MPWAARLSSSVVVVASFVAAALVVVFAGWSLYVTTRQASDAAAWVHHSQEVLRTISSFRERMAEVESAQRGLLLTHSETFLAEREQAITRLERAAARLQALMADEPEQLQQSRQLAALAAERVRLARENGERRLALGTPAPYNGEVRARARAASQQVLALATAMEQREARLLAERHATELERQRHTSIVILLSFAAFAGALLPAYGAVLIESRRRRRTQQQMTAIVDNLPLTVWQMQSAGGQRRFTYVGAGSNEDRGVEAAALRDHDQALQNILPDDRARVTEAMRVAEEALAPLDVSYRLSTADGHDGTRWVHKKARLRRLADGEVLWTGYWADITAQKNLEQALRDATDTAMRASRAKSTFLATMSHEIRTPMNGVLGLLELLSLTELDAEQRSTLAVVQESGRGLLRIIDDILDFSKVEAGRLALHPVPASLRDAIGRACQIHGGIASSRGLLLDQEVDERISPALLFDPLRLGQILNNFISNALKFTSEGRVTVGARLVERQGGAEALRITVTDTGIGVAPEAIEQLFEPFSQADADTPSRYGGTGLGLAICRRLASLMGGTVRMESEPGRGTRMVLEVRFPLADASHLGDHAPELAQRRLTHTVGGRRHAPPVSEAEQEGTLVLVADDHPTNRVVLSRQVVALGYAVVTADDGAEALKLWQSRRIALVLTDVNMPGLSGYDLARRIRAEEAEAGAVRTPIVACTANAMGSEAARCAAAGMDDCLIKPVDLAELMERMDQWLPLPGAAAAVAKARDVAPVATMAPGEVFNPSLLELISGGSMDAERQVLAGFREANDIDLAELERAAAAGDRDELLRLAHRIKGAAQTLGAGAVLAACRALEARVRSTSGTAVELEAQLVALRNASAQLDELLDARMARDPVGG